MKKAEVELIVISLKLNDSQELLYMKFYKTGTIIRYGNGAEPTVSTSGMSFKYRPQFFKTLHSRIPEQLLENPLGYHEPTPNGKIEYVIAFFGVSDNKLTEEEANWTKSTGIRFVLDKQSSYGNEVLSFVDGLAMQAADLTNEWYFDVMMKAHFDMQSPIISKDTVIACPKSSEEKKADYKNYITQIVHANNGNWDIKSLAKDKVYRGADNKQYVPIFNIDQDSFDLNFIPAALTQLQWAERIEKRTEETKSSFKPKKPTKTTETQTRSKWWKLW